MNIFRKEKMIFYLEGILLMALGMLAIVLPQLTTLSLAAMTGIFLLIAGAVIFYRAFRFKSERLFWISVFSAALSALFGALILNNIGAGIFVLTFFLIFFLIFDGILRITLANTLRPYRNWGYLLLSGIVTLIMAFLIIAGLPASAFWAAGLLFGVYLLVAGFSMIAFAIGLEKPREQRAH